MNLKVVLILVLLTIISYKNIAQVPDLILNDYEHKQILPQLTGCSHSNHYKNIFSEKLCGTHNYNFDILNYDLYMDWFEVLSGEDTVVATHSYNGLQKIRFMSKENNLDNITLDAAYLRINSIKFNNLLIENFTQPEENRLTINLPTKLDSGEVAIIEIDYTYILDFNLGMYVYPKGKVIYGNDTLNNEEKLCYTFSQPEIARFWMPCNDNPNEKALVSIAVKVPEKFTVSSNGDLDSVITQDDQNSKSKTFYWSEKRSPLPSYLMVVHASVYKMYEDKYIRVSNPLDTVPIYNYVWQKDYDSKFIDGAVFDAVNSFKPTADILAGYSELFGEYHYESYGHSVVHPSWFGGMEHQRMTSINRYWLRGTAEYGIAHEIAHHWIGDLITCDTWQDIWINEGGASWMEAVWAYKKGLVYGEKTAEAIYDDYLLTRIRYYLEREVNFNKPVYGLPTNDIFNYTAITYTKASWIYNMISKRIGMGQFFSFVKQLLEKYKLSNISTKEFEQDLVEFVNKLDNDLNVPEFFEQWVYNTGHPIYNVNLKYLSASGENNYNYELNLNQMQDGVGFRQVYKNKVKVDLFRNKEIKQTIFIDNISRIQSEIITTDFLVDSVAIDRVYLLCVIWESVVSVTDNYNSTTETIYPNPVNRGEIINIPLNNFNDNIGIFIYNEIGSLIKSDRIITGINNNLNYKLNTSELLTGTYFIVIKDKLNNKYLNFIVL